jgi:uncharacterized membrane protein
MCQEGGQRETQDWGRFFRIQVIPGLIGAAIVGTLFYIVFDVSWLGAISYGVAFAVLSALARLFWKAFRRA